ncbi:hypothetical protein Atai01_31730 [Amycolatopsis taiwanensis]|uniref:Uncharacterized protein n=1 Tax=Amycolatopsis taiwanensis TaxID=342230 RepID=A0A9W6QZT2_9PSEU|nr:hypothetical protein Atai01_31730 [Amycolatopsis taiwanensis]
MSGASSAGRLRRIPLGSQSKVSDQAADVIGAVTRGPRARLTAADEGAALTAVYTAAGRAVSGGSPTSDTA